MNAGEICCREVVVARPDEPVLEAARRMRDEHVGSLVVVEGEPSELCPVGIVTDRDIVVQVLARSADVVNKLDVGDLMTRELAAVTEDATIDSAVATMRQRGVRRLPVVDARGVLVGILSLDDVLEALAEQVQDLARIAVQEQRREREARP